MDDGTDTSILRKDLRGATLASGLDESDLRAAVASANVPALLMVVFQVTGDERWLCEPYLPTRPRGLGDHDTGGLPEHVQDEIREAAIEAILELQAGTCPSIATPSPELITRMASVFMGERVSSEYGAMLSDEFARRTVPDSPQLQLERSEPPPGFKVIVIGTGVAGIAAAHELERMGAEYVILEKQSDLGGIWWQNTYPGAGVDTPSHLYSFFFAKNAWGKHFALRDELQCYFSRVMADIGAADRIRYETEVLAATYDEDACSWRVDVRNADGSTETLHANLVIGAVGVLNRPKLPDLPGMGSFPGPSFHSAEWPEGLDLEGKRVAIVGTGASSMQICPAIAERVERLVIFQRSPQWVAPFEKFLQPISEELQTLLDSCSLYRAWYWIRLFWQFGDKVIEALRVDPDWPFPERSVNARNDGHREFFTGYIRSKLEGREDLVEKALPDYPPFGKRILLDNGWYDTLLRENVTLVNESVGEVREQGLVSSVGELYEADCVIWATGFDVARFVSSMEVRGIGGMSLRDTWNDDDPRAYLGVSVPGFPNFLMLGGPNSFPGSGSFIFFIETQMRYLRELMTEMFKRGIDAIDVHEEANATYNDLLQATHQTMVWTHPGMSTYYRNAHGRVVFVMPFLNVEYWNMMQRPDLENYVTRRARA